MSSAFIQVDKPFYFGGDTIQGHIYLYLVETINANEILVKFKGWESVRWIEERVLNEQEAQNIQNNLIWHNVCDVLLRIIVSIWRVLTLPIILEKMNQWSTTTSKGEIRLFKLEDIQENGSLPDSLMFFIILEEVLSHLDNILFPSLSRLEKSTLHPLW